MHDFHKYVHPPFNRQFATEILQRERPAYKDEPEAIFSSSCGWFQVNFLQHALLQQAWQQRPLQLLVPLRPQPQPQPLPQSQLKDPKLWRGSP